MNLYPVITRFRQGHTYRLKTDKDFPRMIGGMLTVRNEIKPVDTWGNRILLADVLLTYPDGHTENRIAARVFVEEGVSSFVDSYGEHTTPTEIAAVQGLYPLFAKSYAIDELPATAAQSTARDETRQEVA